MTRYGTVEIGGTKTDVGVGSSPDDLDRERIPTTDPETTLGAVIEFFAGMDLPAVGVGAFGPLDLDRRSPRFGSLRSTPKPGWSGTPLLEILTGGLNAPVILDTDVNAAALGEGRWGATQGMADHVYVTVGTGIGAGIVVAGSPISHREHPEAGHVPVRRKTGDRLDGVCAYHGDCLEGLASGPALERRFGPPVTWPGNQEVVDLCSHYLAQGLAVLVYTVAPERIVIGGGVARLPGLHDRVRIDLAGRLAGYPGEPDLDLLVSKPGLGDLSGLAGGLVLAESGALMGTPRLQIRPSNPDFLDLPWDSRLDDWPTDRLVEMPSGVHRHPVKFVAYDEGVYAIKELPVRIAHQEYRVLRVMNGKSHRVAEAVGLVERDWLDHTDEGSGAVITRYVEHSFPYRRLVSGSGFGARRHQMMNALAGLLVELHMAGCFWGDCSLSNVLYRFDAGEIEAIMIDAETSRIYSELSDGQRGEDLEIMMENIAGEMGDIAAETGGDVEAADLTLGADIASRYHALWSELTEELILTRDDAYRIRQRIARINDLGFSVDDIEITPADGVSHVRMSARVGGRTFNSDALRQRTGIEASENQARIILSDLNYYLAKHGDVSATGKSVGTFKWITGQWEPLLAKITEVWPGSDPVQGYCDLLNHRARLAAARGSDVDTFEAFDSWVAEGFPGFDPEEV